MARFRPPLKKKPARDRSKVLSPAAGNGTLRGIRVLAWRCFECYNASVWNGRPTLQWEPCENTRPARHDCPRCGAPWDPSDHRPVLVSAAL